MHAAAMDKNSMELDNVALSISKKSGWQTLVPKKNLGKRKEPPNVPTTSTAKVPKVLKKAMKKTSATGSSNSSSSENESGNDTDNESLEAGEVRHFTVPHKKKTAKLAKVDEVSDAEDLQPNTNRFAALPIEEDEVAKESTMPVETALPKPPPIIVPGVHSIVDMLADLGEITEPGSFTYKATGGGCVRIMPKDSSTYRKIVDHMDNHNMAFRTFQLKENRAFRVVIKGIHSTTPVQHIIDDLKRLGHIVRDIKNAVSRMTKNPMAMFFVNLEPASTNKKVFEVKRLCHAVVTIEEPKKFNDLVQCYRCQAFGHTKRYCRLQYTCVKCGQGHDSTECTKAKDAPATCGNCGEAHTASYQGCRVYIEAKKRAAPKPKVKAMAPPPNVVHTSPVTTNNITRSGFSYAGVTRGGYPQQQQPNNIFNQQGPTDREAALEERIMKRMENMMASMFSQFKEMVLAMFSCQRTTQ